MNASQDTGRTNQVSTDRTVTSTRRAVRVITATAVVVALSALPAAARQDPGRIDPPSPSTATYFCAPQRVGTQFVACDNLTGNGVPAPGWMRER